MAESFFTSDTHFMHTMVARLRGYNSAEEHDEAVVSTWNNSVSKRDVVYHLGDLTLTNPRNVAQLVSRLNGTIHLISGNHDQCHPIFRNAHNKQRIYLEMFESVSTVARVSVLGHRVLLSHFPYTGEGNREQPDRHCAYRLRDEGNTLIHGHTHDAAQRLSQSTSGTPMVHVGLDAWGAPVSAPTIFDLLNA